ncbi:MAG: pyridoxamine kinase [Clostridia bacterium]
MQNNSTKNEFNAEFEVLERQKNVLAIHDISCLGKCSLTVALPIISACGHTTTVLPTAILSTHTGDFTGYTFNDLTNDLIPIVNHWKTLDVHFDCIYAGYLGSIHQIDLVKQIIKMFKTPETLVVIDPVMADYGELYHGFDHAFAKEMATLAAVADIIVPNFTEAGLILDIPYNANPTKVELEKLIMDLHKKTSANIVLTGVENDNNQLGACAFNRDTNKISYSFAEKLNKSFHGTGDIFASALVGEMLRGKTLEEACQIACDFTTSSAKYSMLLGSDLRFGVAFEKFLHILNK